jgi:hypothetical protein
MFPGLPEMRAWGVRGHFLLLLRLLLLPTATLGEAGVQCGAFGEAAGAKR